MKEVLLGVYNRSCRTLALSRSPGYDVNQEASLLYSSPFPERGISHSSSAPIGELVWDTSCLLALRPRAFDSGPSHQTSAKPLAGASLTSPPESVAAHTRTHHCVPRGPQARWSP